eukprot:TRINITY_DN21104_c0_g1_i1.p1 TRINITY_DN21104_c0_g1~~TRINITY_DN21104_c0_g1_i1.p1  ORF type:complete len:557 (+),score=109.86 TRINITY_DN21104_c0_g1_i1:484-2154(+)
MFYMLFCSVEHELEMAECGSEYRPVGLLRPIGLGSIAKEMAAPSRASSRSETGKRSRKRSEGGRLDGAKGAGEGGETQTLTVSTVTAAVVTVTTKESSKEAMMISKDVETPKLAVQSVTVASAVVQEVPRGAIVEGDEEYLNQAERDASQRREDVKPSTSGSFSMVDAIRRLGFQTGMQRKGSVIQGQVSKPAAKKGSEVMNRFVWGFLIGCVGALAIMSGGLWFVAVIAMIAFAASEEYFQLVAGMAGRRRERPPARVAERACSVICGIMPFLTILFNGEIGWFIPPAGLFLCVAAFLPSARRWRQKKVEQRSHHQQSPQQHQDPQQQQQGHVERDQKQQQQHQSERGKGQQQQEDLDETGEEAQQLRSLWSQIGWLLFGLFYCGYLPCFWVKVRLGLLPIPMISGASPWLAVLSACPKWTVGGAATWLSVSTVIAADSFAYVGGKLLGHTPLCAISPKKTWEGAASGLIGSVLMLVALSVRWGWPFSVPSVVTLGVLVFVTSVLGDLFESVLKRDAGAKDSGHLIPGHGGVLDRVDSYIFTGAVVYCYVSYGMG